MRTAPLDRPRVSLACLVLATGMLAVALSGCSTIRHTTNVFYGDVGPAVDEAVCVLTPTAGASTRGTVRFVQDDGHVRVHVELTGLPAGRHALQIHALGDVRDPAGQAVGEVFNPRSVPAEIPEEIRGNLGTVEADRSGTARSEWKNYDLYLHGPESIMGRSLLLAPAEGAPLAQGVIGIAVLGSPVAQAPRP